MRDDSARRHSNPKFRRGVPAFATAALPSAASALSVALAVWQHLRHRKRIAGEEDTDF
jgi:hypothetical protein